MHPFIPVLSPSFLYHPYIPSFRFFITCILSTTVLSDNTCFSKVRSHNIIIRTTITHSSSSWNKGGGGGGNCPHRPPPTPPPPQLHYCKGNTCPLYHDNMPFPHCSVLSPHLSVINERFLPTLTQVFLISQFLLLQTTPPSAMVRLKKSSLRSQYYSLNQLYRTQHHSSIDDFLDYHLSHHTSRGGLLLQVCLIAYT